MEKRPDDCLVYRSINSIHPEEGNPWDPARLVILGPLEDWIPKSLQPLLCTGIVATLARVATMPCRRDGSFILLEKKNR